MVRHKTLRKHYLRKHYYESNKKKTRTKRITKRRAKIQKMRRGGRGRGHPLHSRSITQDTSSHNRRGIKLRYVEQDTSPEGKILKAMKLFEDSITNSWVSRQFWEAERELFINKFLELEENPDSKGFIYDIARIIKKKIREENREEDKTIPLYSTLQVVYLPHIKPNILSLRSDDEPNIKLEKFIKIKEHIGGLLEALSFVEKEINISSNDAIKDLNTINDILTEEITRLDPKSRPLEKHAEGVQIVQGEFIKPVAGVPIVQGEFIKPVAGVPTVESELIEEAPQDSGETQMREAPQDSGETQMGETLTEEAKPVGGTRKSRKSRKSKKSRRM